MEFWHEPILFRGEDESRYYKEWRVASVELDRVASAITVRGHRSGAILTTIPVTDIHSYRIVEMEDITTFSLSGTGDIGAMILDRLLFWLPVLVDRSIDNQDHTDVFVNHGHNCPVARDRCGAGW